MEKSEFWGNLPMMRLLVAVLLLFALPAAAASIAPFNPNNLQIPATGVDFNNLIAAINAIVTPLEPTVPGSVNAISLTPALTGAPAQIGLQTGADTNAGIQINPNGSGNITLFGSADTGVLQIGNSSGFVPGNGVDRCPGAAGIQRVVPGGPSLTVRGYFLMQDWLGRSYASVVC